MIKIILEELAENGTDPIERATLTKEIVARWPNVNIVSLRQTIWRLGNEGKIEVAGDLVSLKTKTGTAEDDAVDMGQEQAPPPTYPFAASELKGS